MVVGGGPDYYPGHKTASPGFSFRATHIRLAGEGDLLAQLEQSRRRLDADGLLTRQAALSRPAIPRTIGVVTARSSAACADLLAGLERRGWRGTIVWADAPVQDRRAAPAIARALTELAALPQVEVAVVCRGGGSLTDLWAFCDEDLCRRIALLRLPVVSAVGHDVDRTLIDDVAAVSCSTPTHAADALVRCDVNRGHAPSSSRASRPRRPGRARRRSPIASAGSARLARAGPRGPPRAPRLHQQLREVRAAASRGIALRSELAARHGLVVTRKGAAFTGAENAARGRLLSNARTIELRSAAALSGRAERLATLAQTARAHDPERTLERGYALVADPDGEPITSAAEARERDRLAIRFADDAVRATVDREPDER